jgi:hypothetical protein
MDMDTSLTVRLRDSARVARAKGASARTEVAPTQSVTPPAPAEPIHPSPEHQDALTHDLVDPQGREVLYRERDVLTQRLRKRAADQALMRQRAYGRAPQRSEQPPEDGTGHADIEV